MTIGFEKLLHLPFHSSFLENMSNFVAVTSVTQQGAAILSSKFSAQLISLLAQQNSPRILENISRTLANLSMIGKLPYKNVASMIFIRSPNLISDDICINFFQRDHKFDLLSVVLQNNSLNTNSHLVNANVARCLANLSANGFATIEKTNRLHFNAVLVFFFFVQFKIIVENFQLLIVEKDWLQPILGWIRLNVDENLDLACLTTLANLASNRAICLVIFATIQTIYPTLFTNLVDRKDQKCLQQTAQLVANLSEHGKPYSTPLTAISDHVTPFLKYQSNANPRFRKFVESIVSPCRNNDSEIFNDNRKY